MSFVWVEVAGPGTGKTRVITRRVGYLVEDQKIDPRRILALTFSRAAGGGNTTVACTKARLD
jgi:superfamily I DNA/RNA helicase